MMSLKQLQKLRNGHGKGVEEEDVNDAVTLPETDDDEAYESEEETKIAQAMVRAAFTKSASTPVLNLLLKAALEEERLKRRRSSIEEPQDDEGVLSSALTMAQSMKQQRKKPKHDTKAPQRFVKSQVRLSISEPSLESLPKKIVPKPSLTSTTKPTDKLQSLFLQAGVPYKTFCYKSLRGFFCKLQDEHIQNYDLSLVRAVRDQDMDALRSRTSTLHAGNKFGETILHAACRRGALACVELLLDHHPIRVCCDYGRTVLHDAVWTCQPNFLVIDRLLDACPDLLYISDRRGNCALDYVPVDQHAQWCEYLEHRGIHRLRPGIL